MDPDLRKLFVGAGLVLLAAGAVGGGVKIAGNEVPAIAQPLLRLACAAGGLALTAIGLWRRRPRVQTYIVTQPTSSISVPRGTIADARYVTTTYGGGTYEIVAADYHRADDGSYIFTDTRGAKIRELPRHKVDSVRIAHQS